MILQRLMVSCTLTVLLSLNIMAQQEPPSPVTAEPPSQAAPPPSQTAAASSSLQQEAAQKELEKKAFALLNDVIADAQGLRLPENRIRLQANVANLLWTKDEPRARALFREATNGVAALIKSSDGGSGGVETGEVRVMSGSSMSGRMSEGQRMAQSGLMLRHELLQPIAQRDPQLALDFLRATRQPTSQTAAARPHQPDQELYMELNLANIIAGRDPKQALRIAEESLAKGLSYGLINLVHQVYAKDKEGAAKLMDGVVKKLRSENLAANQEAANVALQLLSTTRRRAATANFAGQPPADAGQSAITVIDEQSLRDIADKVAADALSASSSTGASLDWNESNNARNLLMRLQSVMPEVEKYAAARAPLIRKKIAEFNKTLDPQSRAWREYEELMQNGNVEALLAAVPKAPREMRDHLYQQAASKAMNGGDDVRARQILNEHVADPQQRKQMLAYLDQQTLWRATAAGKLDQARGLLANLPSNEDRINALVQLARAVAAKDDKKGAGQLLDEARSLIPGRAENHAQLNAQLSVAAAYADFAPTRGFEMLEPTVDHLNELAAAAAVLNGFGTENFIDGELTLQGGGGFLHSMIQQCAIGLAALARTDFDRAKSAADRFQRNEARIMARLAVAQGVLFKQSNMNGGARQYMSINSGEHEIEFAEGFEATDVMPQQ